MGEAKRRKLAGEYPVQPEKNEWICEAVGHEYLEKTYLGTTFDHEGDPVEVFEEFCFICGRRNEFKEKSGGWHEIQV